MFETKNSPQWYLLEKRKRVVEYRGAPLTLRFYLGVTRVDMNSSLYIFYFYCVLKIMVAAEHLVAILVTLDHLEDNKILLFDRPNREKRTLLRTGLSQTRASIRILFGKSEPSSSLFHTKELQRPPCDILHSL